MTLFRHAKFEISVARTEDMPPSHAPEIAFAGRSNAGKSSAINTLVQHNRLAFVSKTPGRTQLINVFRMTNGAALVDLPGYGYAKVPDAVRRDWIRLLENYLTRRENLIGLVLIMDARHPLKDLDRQMLNWFAMTGRPIHVLLSKCDKLTRSEAARTLAKVREELMAWADDAQSKISVQLFSSLKKLGMSEAEKAVGAWMGRTWNSEEEVPHGATGEPLTASETPTRKAPNQAPKRVPKKATPQATPRKRVRKSVD
ncbi:MAG TPA: ribosome biogenesis GTP-binding protein YihA/YsxC [Rhodocyclaceae bacterium]|nr:ribosome biogenesis GTP-binding protein YihA/YsxC [Rhodocyclaceae bacterium]